VKAPGLDTAPGGCQERRQLFIWRQLPAGAQSVSGDIRLVRGGHRLGVGYFQGGEDATWMSRGRARASIPSPRSSPRTCTA